MAEADGASKAGGKSGAGQSGDGGAAAEKFGAAIRDAKSTSAGGGGGNTASSGAGASSGGASASGATGGSGVEPAVAARAPELLRVPGAPMPSRRATPTGFAPGYRPHTRPHGHPVAPGRAPAPAQANQPTASESARLVGDAATRIQYAAGTTGAVASAQTAQMTALATGSVTNVRSMLPTSSQIALAQSQKIMHINPHKVAGAAAALTSGITGARNWASLSGKQQSDVVANLVKGTASLAGEIGTAYLSALGRAGGTQFDAGVLSSAITSTLIRRGVPTDLAQRVAGTLASLNPPEVSRFLAPAASSLTNPVAGSQWLQRAASIAGTSAPIINFAANGVQVAAGAVDSVQRALNGDYVGSSLQATQTLADLATVAIAGAQLANVAKTPLGFTSAALANGIGLAAYAARMAYDELRKWQAGFIARTQRPTG